MQYANFLEFQDEILLEIGMKTNGKLHPQPVSTQTLRLELIFLSHVTKQKQLPYRRVKCADLVLRTGLGWKDSRNELPLVGKSGRAGFSTSSDMELGFYRKCPHEKKLITKKMLVGTFDRILLNEADGAAGAGSYGNLWVLKEVFSESLGFGLKIGRRNPRYKHAVFH